MKDKRTKKQLIDELSELRHRINQLEASESELNSLKEALSIVYDAIDSTVGGIVITNLEGRITYVNPAFLRIFEYNEKSEVLGVQAADLFDSKEARMVPCGCSVPPELLRRIGRHRPDGMDAGC